MKNSLYIETRKAKAIDWSYYFLLLSMSLLIYLGVYIIDKPIQFATYNHKPSVSLDAAVATYTACRDKCDAKDLVCVEKCKQEVRKMIFQNNNRNKVTYHLKDFFQPIIGWLADIKSLPENRS